MHRGWWVLGAGLLLAGSACSRSRAAAPDTAEAQPAEALVRVHVINHYREDMQIIASGGGSTQRLGLVAAGLERDFDIPQVLVGTGAVAFVAQPSGRGPIVRSDQVRVRRGAIVDFEITTNLINSNATVRP
jgi:hypothetical protein